MAILVSGGAGYIGSHTCIELLNAGYDIVVADNYYNASPVVLDRVKQITGKDFRFVEADMTDKAAVEALFAQSEEDEEENPELANARALVERHYAAKLAQGKWQQVAAALARRGFSHSVIRQALADAETEETEA